MALKIEFRKKPINTCNAVKKLLKFSQLCDIITIQLTLGKMMPILQMPIDCLPW